MAKPVCNPTFNSCVGCLGNADCKDPAASLCNTTTNACTPCVGDADCSQISGKGVCDAGTCVQCTGKKYAACGTLDGKALVCDSLAKTCTTDKKLNSAGPCQPCVSDAQCKPGQLCAPQSFKGALVGNFCFWKQGDTANGAPATCDQETNRPYVSAKAESVSIDQETATLCMVASVTTCTAIGQYRSTNCAPNGTPNDSLCGFASGVDSKCVLYNAASGSYRCTNVCLSADDCQGSTGTGTTGITCDASATPKVCTLQ